MQWGICQGMSILVETTRKCVCLGAFRMACHRATSIIKDRWAINLRVIKAYISLPPIIMVWAWVHWRSTANEHEHLLNWACPLIQV